MPRVLLLFLWLIQRTIFAQPTLIVTTDIGQDPDDQQSLVRLLHYADKFQLAGIITNADANYADELPVPRPDIVHDLIDAYAHIERNLRIHSPDYPSADYLHGIVKTGCAGNGKKIPLANYVGRGMDTEGSDWIVELVDQTIGVPIYVSVWGGACDLAQVLWKVKQERSAEETARFVSKLRVYFIGKQDSSNEWIINTFPDLWLILALAENGNSWDSTYRGMFLGGDLSTTSKDWLHTYVIGQNPLADLYPDEAYTGGADRNPHGALKEGDSPSLLYFIENGLNVLDHPEWGGWGGRFAARRGNLYRDTPDRVTGLPDPPGALAMQASVYRWRPDFQNDFAARVRWGAADDYGAGNHYPVIQFTRPMVRKHYTELVVRPGDTLSLDASLSFDPDGDAVLYDWFVYPEASDLEPNGPLGRIKSDAADLSFPIPDMLTGTDIHLILRVRDDNPTPLVSYRRFVIHVGA